MVKQPISVEPWQPVAHARQLMLMHSFLPVRHEQAWFLLSELALALFLNCSREERAIRLGLSIADALGRLPGLALTPVAETRLLTGQHSCRGRSQGWSSWRRSNALARY